MRRQTVVATFITMYIGSNHKQTQMKFRKKREKEKERKQGVRTTQRIK